jgi:hypothetical protein
MAAVVVPAVHGDGNHGMCRIGKIDNENRTTHVRHHIQQQILIPGDCNEAKVSVFVVEGFSASASDGFQAGRVLIPLDFCFFDLGSAPGNV